VQLPGARRQARRLIDVARVELARKVPARARGSDPADPPYRGFAPVLRSKGGSCARPVGPVHASWASPPQIQSEGHRSAGIPADEMAPSARCEKAQTDPRWRAVPPGHPPPQLSVMRPSAILQTLRSRSPCSPVWAACALDIGPKSALSSSTADQLQVSFGVRGWPASLCGFQQLGSRLEDKEARALGDRWGRRSSRRFAPQKLCRGSTSPVRGVRKQTWRAAISGH
jgi:hypothetical protein